MLSPGTLTVVTGTGGTGGTGGTALFDLVAGLAPTEGTVRFDGIDVRRLDGDRLAAGVAVVTRRPFLVPGSIAENVTLGAACTDAELTEALRIAALRESADPADHRVQVATARAVLRRPRLLVLDDATAELEPDVERQLLQNLAETTITVLAATDRPGQFADQIVRLAADRITVIGRHDAQYHQVVHPRTPEPIPATAV
ncbi:ATP-binding cassette domain-containing protein [Actinoplanes sp. M2I2]|uniref:ATP-binding cassette domain-containing protein n=1 Tax=Actinoplanes sp. M2I2 TaxID=1734444 RepID=UPI0027E20A76|nr:ATP-binding cassette domain-containing protein [Actinoplanes sp. M2I2]